MKHKEKFIKKGVGAGKRADARPVPITVARKESAITLIALVITIIVLLILAGVTIAMVVGDNGILTRARQAKAETETAEFVEKVQVAAVGSLNTDGKVDLENLKSELEKIDIETDAEEFPVIVEKNDEKLFIYDDGEVVKDSSDEYIKNGLMVAYDGINNTGNGHDSDAKVWKDLSGNGNDGTLKGEAKWQDNCLNFDGIDDWVDIGKMNFENVTLEAVVMHSNVNKSGEQDFIANWDQSGCGLSYLQRNNMPCYINNDYIRCYGANPTKNNFKYCLSGKFDEKNIVLFENTKRYEQNAEGKMKQSNLNTILGANPNSR